MALQSPKTSIQINKSRIFFFVLMRITSTVGHGFQMHVRALESSWAVEPSIRQVSRGPTLVVFFVSWDDDLSEHDPELFFQVGNFRLF